VSYLNCHYSSDCFDPEDFFFEDFKDVVELARLPS